MGALKKPVEVVEEVERFERLIAAIESNTNANARLLQELQGKRARKRESRAARQRRVALDKPVVVTPLVEAAARRALERMRRR
jgi:hypothetical protein